MARLGDVLTIGAMPVEMTTLMGRRVVKTLAADRRRFALVGLANEYLGYTTTREEYDAQDYEGASTLYGPRQGEGIIELFQRVRKQLDLQPGPLVSALKFDAGPRPRSTLGPESIEPRNYFDEDLEPLMGDSTGRQNCLAPRFEWHEDAQHDWETRCRKVRVARRDAGQWVTADDDLGSNFLTVLVDRENQRHWAVIWLPPAGHDRTAQYRFEVIRPESREPICSEPFSLLTQAPAQWPTPSARPTPCR